MARAANSKAAAPVPVIPGSAGRTRAARTADTVGSAAGGQAHARGASEASLSGRYALAREPLGIVLALLILAEFGMALALRFAQIAAADASFLIRAMAVLAFATLGGFFLLWYLRPGALYSPSRFRDERTWLAAVTREDVVASSSLPLPSIVHCCPQ